MKKSLFNFLGTVLVTILIVTVGVFLCRMIISVVTYFVVGEFADTLMGILYKSIKAGLTGGTIGGVGIWILYLRHLRVR